MKMPLRVFAPSLSRTTMQAGMPVPQKRLIGQIKDAPYVAALDEVLTNGAFDRGPQSFENCYGDLDTTRGQVTRDVVLIEHFKSSH